MRLSFMLAYRDLGLLVLRAGLGAMYLWHGFPKILGGAEVWHALGRSMTYLGVESHFVAWGLAGALTEFLGGLLLLLGFFFRPACLFLFASMAVAASMHLGRGDGMVEAAHPIEVGLVFLSLVLIGPGKYSFDESPL